ncbi:hypothetical protein E2C01_015330 [Portunus trituberculatus]|uniref:Uncharacterized protein n=1 Tax=Portunus trituberculatus TaxID=210409 RepID=A0A5B7DLC4_PORTR|nr:hypothetical protein [Portunus trituberculatus]
MWHKAQDRGWVAETAPALPGLGTAERGATQGMKGGGGSAPAAPAPPAPGVWEGRDGREHHTIWPMMGEGGRESARVEGGVRQKGERTSASRSVLVHAVQRERFTCVNFCRRLCYEGIAELVSGVLGSLMAGCYRAGVCCRRASTHVVTPPLPSPSTIVLPSARPPPTLNPRPTARLTRMSSRPQHHLRQTQYSPHQQQLYGCSIRLHFIPSLIHISFFFASFQSSCLH